MVKQEIKARGRVCLSRCLLRTTMARSESRRAYQKVRISQSYTLRNRPVMLGGWPGTAASQRAWSEESILSVGVGSGAERVVGGSMQLNLAQGAGVGRGVNGSRYAQGSRNTTDERVADRMDEVPGRRRGCVFSDTRSGVGWQLDGQADAQR